MNITKIQQTKHQNAPTHMAKYNYTKNKNQTKTKHKNYTHNKIIQTYRTAQIQKYKNTPILQETNIEI